MCTFHRCNSWDEREFFTSRSTATTLPRRREWKKWKFHLKIKKHISHHDSIYRQRSLRVSGSSRVRDYTRRFFFECFTVKNLRLSFSICLANDATRSSIVSPTSTFEHYQHSFNTLSSFSCMSNGISHKSWPRSRWLLINQQSKWTQREFVSGPTKEAWKISSTIQLKSLKFTQVYTFALFKQEFTVHCALFSETNWMEKESSSTRPARTTWRIHHSIHGSEQV